MARIREFGLTFILSRVCKARLRSSLTIASESVSRRCRPSFFPLSCAMVAATARAAA